MVFNCTETRLPKQVQPVNITHSAREDFRPGFEHHAIVNITWKRQEGK